MNKQKGALGLIVAVIAALVLAGGAYWYQRSQSLGGSTAKSALTTTLSTTNASDTDDWKTYTKDTDDWKTYTNVKYGFEITFPDSWRGYRVATKETSGGTILSISLPTSDGTGDSKNGYSGSILYLYLQTKAEWQKSQAEAEIHPPVLGQNDKYVISYDTNHADILPTDVNNILKKSGSDIRSVLSTFKFTK